MALFLGTWNVPTNKKLRVNSTDVTVVMCNGVVVWRYVKPATPGTGTGTGTTKPPVGGSKGKWSQLLGSVNQIRIVRTYDTHCNLIKTETKIYIGGVNHWGNMPAGYGYGTTIKAPQPCTGHTGAGFTSVARYTILKWIPAP